MGCSCSECPGGSGKARRDGGAGGGGRAVALLSRGSPLPTPPMPGRLDVAEGLSPLRVGSLQRTRAKEVTRSPAISNFFFFCSCVMCQTVW